MMPFQSQKILIDGTFCNRFDGYAHCLFGEVGGKA